MVWRRFRQRIQPGQTDDQMILSTESVQAALRGVRDPILQRDVVSLRMFDGVQAADGKAALQIALPFHGYDARDRLEAALAAALEPLGAAQVEVEYSVRVPAWEGAGQQAAIPGVKNVIAVASNKGGVGKSTISSNLAVALAASGADVGLVDADATGPNLPTMFGLPAGFQAQSEQGLHPVERFGVKVISLGFLLPPGAPVVWRGPMIGSAIRQLLHDVQWGSLDYLLVDLPPGTSDASMSLAQEAPVAGAVIVSTPQQVALEDAAKAVAMFEKLDVPVFGIVENMSYFIAPGSGERHEIFGHGGAAAAADDLEIDFLEEVPLATEIRAGGDGGKPIVAAEPEHPASSAFASLAGKVAAKAAAGALLQPQRLDVPIMAEPRASGPAGAPGRPPQGGGRPERPKSII